MAQILYEEKVYNSRSQLIIHLLLLKKYNKATIAELADSSPQLVEYNYKKLVKRGTIDDYYGGFVKQRRDMRLKRMTRKTGCSDV